MNWAIPQFEIEKKKKTRPRRSICPMCLFLNKCVTVWCALSQLKIRNKYGVLSRLIIIFYEYVLLNKNSIKIILIRVGSTVVLTLTTNPGWKLNSSKCSNPSKLKLVLKLKPILSRVLRPAISVRRSVDWSVSWLVTFYFFYSF